MRITVRRLPFRSEFAFIAEQCDRDLIWFDSAMPRGSTSEAAERARWSIIAPGDGPFRAEVLHRERRAVLRVAPASERWFGRSRASETPAFVVIDDLLERTPLVSEPIPGCGFALGWAGYLGYELGREVGGPDRVADGHPDAHLRFVDRAVVVDERDHVTWILTLAADGEVEASAENAAWAERMTVRLEASSGRARPVRRTVPTDPAWLVEGTPKLSAPGGVSRRAYMAAVETCRQEIRDGNAFQVCLTTAFAVPAAGPDLGEYMTMREGDPVPFGAFLRLGAVRVASRSPERFIAITADGTVTAEPIKGTCPRGADPASDAALAEALRASGKERAENVMIVDLLRNDLLRTALPGSIRVDRLCAVESYTTVHQLVSTVRATLPAGCSRVAVVRNAFPPGSMTGAPKHSAMAIADGVESGPRGVYSGAIGYFSASGAVQLSVAIRTLVSVFETDGRVRSRRLGAGGAVTWPSKPRAEADEVETKTRSVLEPLGMMPVW